MSRYIMSMMMKDIETAITQRITHSHVNWSDVVKNVRRPVENNTTIIRIDDIDIVGNYIRLLEKYMRIPRLHLIATATAAGLDFDINAKPVFIDKPKKET